MTGTGPERDVTPHGVHHSGAPLRAAYGNVICDLDGVVYRGRSEVPGATAALRALRAHGVRVVFATNNASRVPQDVVDHLATFRLSATAEDIVTSAQAGAVCLAERIPAGERVLALGGDGVVEALSQAGFAAVRPGSPTAGAPVGAVLQGFGPELRVRDFEDAARQLADGAVWVATNGDSTLPLEWGLGPGNGAYVALLESVAGRSPVVVGKPHAPLYRLAMDRLGALPESTLAVGDRLDTDIAGAVAAGIDSAWVLTGVDSPSALLTADAARTPTHVIGSLSDLNLPYAAPLRAAEGWACGGGWVSVGPTGLDVASGRARPIELVRAAIAAVRATMAQNGASSIDLALVGPQLDALADRTPLP